MKGSIERMVTADLAATGLPHSIERGNHHLKIKLRGVLVGILPMNGRGSETNKRTYLNVRSQIRRKAKELI